MLKASGYDHVRNKRLNSMSLKQYLLIIEKKFEKKIKEDPQSEIKLVEEYLRKIEE